MKILVTGANGYLGQGIVKQLVEDGNVVIATDYCTSYIDIRANRIECDLFSIENPYAFFDEPDALLHLAWRDGFVHNSFSHIDDLPKHVHFISKMIEAGTQKIAVMGTMHEIGFFEGSINESTPTNPTTMYGIGKNALRNIVCELCKRNQSIFQWLRGFYIVGNTSYGASIFSKITAAENNGEKFFPFTTGQNQYDFVDYEMFCSMVAKTVEQEKITGIINICSGRPEKLADRVERFIKDNSYSIKLEYGKFPDRPYDSKAIWGDSEKIYRILNEK